MDFARDRQPARTRESRYEPFPVDVADHGDAYVVTAVLPGVSPSAVQVHVRRRDVLLTVDFTDAGPSDAAFRPERGVTHREIPLPSTVTQEGARATFVEDCLSVRVAKDRPTGPKRRSE